MKEPYTSPTLNVVVFQVERGFGVSNDQVILSFIQNNNDNYQVSGNEASSYTNEHWQW